GKTPSASSLLIPCSCAVGPRNENFELSRFVVAPRNEPFSGFCSFHEAGLRLKPAHSADHAGPAYPIAVHRSDEESIPREKSNGCLSPSAARYSWSLPLGRELSVPKWTILVLRNEASVCTRAFVVPYDEASVAITNHGWFCLSGLSAQHDCLTCSAV